MKLLKWLDKNLELLILAIFLAIMSVLSFSNVIMRYCFRSSLSWSDEVCCYCLALSAFYCLPCSIRMGSSIRVDTFLLMFPKIIQNILIFICNIIMIAFLGIALGGTATLVSNAAKIGQASPALQIPISYLYTAMGVGIVLGIIRSIQRLIFDLMTMSNRKIKEEET